MKRRDFLGACAIGTVGAGAAYGFGSALLGGNESQSAAYGRTPPGKLLTPGLAAGHRLRDGGFAALPTPTEIRKLPVLIVGAGIGGLSAGWKLQRAGFTDFALLELGDAAGGNSRSERNTVSAFPLGAHYLPLPPREAVHVRELLADLGAIEGDAQVLRPVYAENRLCHTPQERLYRDGLWQDGIVPQQGLSVAERDEIKRFLAGMEELKEAHDGEGRRAFALPIELSSPAEKWRRLDRISMADWLRGEGFSSAPLFWYVNYACRDDFGCDIEHTSAWAGLHYFACRNGEAANAASDTVLTAPEGNGWIVNALATRLAPHLQRSAMAYRVEEEARGINVDVWLNDEGRSVRYRAEHLIWAAPLFVFARVAVNAPEPLRQAASAGTYAPWLVANLTLSELPQPGAGAPLAWDNVLYQGQGLGYIVATHQNLRVHQGASVITWYDALSDASPEQARAMLLATPREALAERVLGELGRVHADLRRLTVTLDLCLHGHAMIRPTPGALWGAVRRRLTLGGRRIQFAHADVSGMSLFEEANYRGVTAAARVLKTLRGV